MMEGELLGDREGIYLEPREGIRAVAGEASIKQSKEQNEKLLQQVLREALQSKS